VLLFSNFGETRPPQDAFRASLARGSADAVLLTPTTSLAEQHREQFARQGFLVRPDSIVTLSRFVEPLVRDCRPAPPAVIDRIVADELVFRPPPVFAPLARSSGLRKNLAALIDELASALPLDEIPAPSGLTEAAAAFFALYARVAERLTAAGFWLRGARLREAAARLRQQGHPWSTIYVSGFHGFTPAEREILTVLAGSRLCVTLSEGEAAAETRQWLSARFPSTPLPDPPRPPHIEIHAAANSQREAEFLATQILEAHADGIPFRHMGVVMRSENPYRPLLEATFQRYGIPTRAYFQNRLSDHPLALFLTGFLKAILHGWNYEALLPLVASPYSGLAPTAVGDHLEHHLRAKLPGAGLPDPLAKWAPWERLRDSILTPAQWAQELGALLQLAPLPAVRDRVSASQVLLWRREVSAREGWINALDLCRQALPDLPLNLADFHQHLTEVLPHVSIDDRDARRDAVSLLDAYEARQWRLPWLYLCGMVERGFPRYHTQHPILTDADRQVLYAHGIVLRTSGERQRDEQALFQSVVCSAGEKLIVSYPRAGASGEEFLPSFLLTQVDTFAQPAIARRPPALWRKAPTAPARIADRRLLAHLKKLRGSLSPTAIESYLQCPFQFFSRHLLRPDGPPEEPAERLDLLLQGNILHQTLALSEGSPLFVEEIFLRLFRESCEKAAVPPGWRTEKARLDLRRNLLRFLASPPLAGARTLSVESDFDLKLSDDLRIRGKIDRLAELPERGLVVIDYKYSTPERVRGRVRSHMRGELVQGGLYLWAAQKLRKLKPAAMLYCGLRNEVSWAGWHLPMFGWHELGEACDAEQLQQMIQQAVDISLEVAGRISNGVIAPAPADDKKCTWCESRDLCRVEEAPAPLTQIAGGAQ
jgi:hypothetical protein